MKKQAKIITSTLALLLSVPFMAACQNNNGSTSNGGGWEPVERILVDAPETFVVGDTINLDEYVEIKGGKGSTVFDVEVRPVSEGIVSVDGHVVTVLAEGTISLKIVAGIDEGQKSAMFEAEAISTIKALYHDATKDITNVYGFGMYYSEEDAKEEGVEPGIHDYILHNENYLWVSGWDEDEDGNIVPGGMIRTAGGFTHWFTGNADNTEITVEPEKQADFDLYYINGDFALPYTALETRTYTDETTGAQEDYLYIDYKDTTGSLDALLSYNMGIGWNAMYTTHSVQIYPLFDEDGNYSPYWEFDVYIAKVTTPKIRAALGVSMILYTDPADCKVDVCENYIKEGKEPEALDYTPLTNAFDAIVNAKNYTLTTKTQLSVVDASGKETLVTNDEHDIPSYNIRNGDVETTYVNADDAFTTVTTATGDSTSFGYRNVEGTVYSYTQDEEDPTKYVGTATDKVTDIWDDKAIITAASLGSACANTYKDFEINTIKESKGVTTITLTGLYSKAWSIAVLSLSNVGYAFVDLMAQYDEMAIPDGYVSFYNFLKTTVEISDSKITVTFKTELSPAFVTMADGSDLDLTITSTFTNIGTTTWSAVDFTPAA